MQAGGRSNHQHHQSPWPRRNAHTETAAISSIFLPRRPVFLQNVEKKSAEMVRTTTVRIRTFEEIHDRSTEEQYERTPRCRAKIKSRAKMDIPRLARGPRTRDFFHIHQEKSALPKAYTTIPYAERESRVLTNKKRRTPTGESVRESRFRLEDRAQIGENAE